MDDILLVQQIQAHGSRIVNRHTTTITLLLFLQGIVWVAGSETRVSGRITQSTRWTAEKGPYIVRGDLVIEKQARLSIAPGTRILISPPVHYDSDIQQYDSVDSVTTAIKIKGMLSCIGRRDQRIVFAPLGENRQNSWYGIVFDESYDQLTEIAFADIAGACNGVVVRGCSPIIRNSIIEFNNVGILCKEKGNARVYNCVISSNQVAGIRAIASNPVFYNNIIVNTKNNGLWCDGVSQVDFKYNCLFGNADGDLLDCDPRLGILLEKKASDSTDYAHNIYRNPIFAGSPEDSVAVEHDISLPTEKSRISDTTLAKVLHEELVDSLAAKRRERQYPRFSLSPYSPCRDAGAPFKQMKDPDGSRNDMGIYGGPEFFEELP